jgi:DMSO/TMAO reductase YedYZ heme-binding membrane subunit
MDPKVWWYLSRATGLVAWGLAVGSIIMGLALATRALGSKPKAPWLLSLHRWLGGLTVLFTAGHVASVVADSFVHFGPADVLVPFASSWRPVPVAWGVLAAWLLVAIEVTSLQMRRLSKRSWHAIHMTSYLVAVLATVHGLTAGADTTNPIFAWAMVTAVATMAFFTVYRRLAPARSPRPGASGPATARSRDLRPRTTPDGARA